MHGIDNHLMDKLTATSEAPYVGFGAAEQTTAERYLISDPVHPVVSAPSSLDPWSAFTRRSLDVALSLTLLVLLLPMMLLTAAVVVFVDPGPVFFGHRRVGRNGRPFNCYKFRTMLVGADDQLNRLLAEVPALRSEWLRSQKLLNDPRVTPVGRLLRTSCIDELPQLFNVLMGEMSLVGPRPITSAELDRYGRYGAMYLCVRPGLTGLWQVTRSAETTYRRRVASDVLYARRQSLGFDCQILIATIPAVLSGRGSC